MHWSYQSLYISILPLITELNSAPVFLACWNYLLELSLLAPRFKFYIHILYFETRHFVASSRFRDSDLKCRVMSYFRVAWQSLPCYTVVAQLGFKRRTYCRAKVEFNMISLFRHGRSTTFETGLSTDDIFRDGKLLDLKKDSTYNCKTQQNAT